jgi:hypothetical protein
MSQLSKFSEIRAIFEEAATQIPDFTFSSGDYQQAAIKAEEVFNRVQSYCFSFLEIIKGLRPLAGIPDYEEVMCFPKRFLKQPSTRFLSPDRREKADQIVETNFLMGLVYYLIMIHSQARGQFEEADIDGFMPLWILETLQADKLTKHLNDKECEGLPQFIFDTYYKAQTELILRDLGIGYFARAQCRSYFRNLFFAGLLLGVRLDAAKTNLGKQPWI